MKAFLTCPQGGVCDCNPASANSTRNSPPGITAGKRQLKEAKQWRVTSQAGCELRSHCPCHMLELRATGWTFWVNLRGLPSAGYRHGGLTGHLAKAQGETGQLHHADSLNPSLVSPQTEEAALLSDPFFRYWMTYIIFFWIYLLCDFLEVHQICKAATAPLIQIQMQGHLLTLFSCLLLRIFPDGCRHIFYLWHFNWCPLSMHHL